MHREGTVHTASQNKIINTSSIASLGKIAFRGDSQSVGVGGPGPHVDSHLQYGVRCGCGPTPGKHPGVAGCASSQDTAHHAPAPHHREHKAHNGAAVKPAGSNHARQRTQPRQEIVAGDGFGAPDDHMTHPSRSQYTECRSRQETPTNAHAQDDAVEPLTGWRLLQ